MHAKSGRLLNEEAGDTLEIAIEKPEWQTMEQLLKAKTAFDIKWVFTNVLLAVKALIKCFDRVLCIHP